MITEGMKTSEFWLTVATLAAGVVLAGVGAYTENSELVSVGTTLIGIATGGYAVSRGLAKKGNAK